VGHVQDQVHAVVVMPCTDLMEQAALHAQEPLGQLLEIILAQIVWMAVIRAMME